MDVAPLRQNWGLPFGERAYFVFMWCPLRRRSQPTKLDPEAPYVPYPVYSSLSSPRRFYCPPDTPSPWGHHFHKIGGTRTLYILHYPSRSLRKLRTEADWESWKFQLRAFALRHRYAPCLSGNDPAAVGKQLIPVPPEERRLAE